MNWIKVFLINIFILTSLLILCSLLLHAWDYFNKSEQHKESNYDTNTIRATYPNYSKYSHDEAMCIFENYRAPKTSYQPFIEWRRNEHKSSCVNIEPQYKTRISYHQQINDSFWFLGGSTTWGTGASDEETIPSYFAKISNQGVWNLGETAFNSFQELIQLQILLVNGLTPSTVVFYDGINDGLYCNTNNLALPNHSREDEYRISIAEYRKNKDELNRLKKENNIQISSDGNAIHYIKKPLKLPKNSD